MNKMNLKYSLVALLGLGISANVSAVDYTCADITFTPEAFEAYEFVDKACLDVVERNGAVYAKLTARIVGQMASATNVRYYHADGDLGPTSRFPANSEFQTGVEGKTVKLADVALRSDANVYVPMRFWSPPAPPPVEAAATAAPPPPPPPPPAPEPEPEPEPEVLPTTASSVPLLALFGGLFLVLGSALRLSRKQ